MGICAGLAVLVTLDGPGLTIDEPLDVRPGRTYLKVVKDRGWHFFDRAVVEKVFRDNAEHPPLGRWLLGIASVAGEPFEVLWKGPDPTGQYVLAGRLAPTVAFAVLVGLIAFVGASRWGLAAGAAASFALVAMPRVFAHAHLAALDTFLSLFWTLALVTGERSVRARHPLAAMAAPAPLVARAPDQDPRLVPAADPGNLGARLGCRRDGPLRAWRSGRSSGPACSGWAGPGSGTIP